MTKAKPAQAKKSSMPPSKRLGASITATLLAIMTAALLTPPPTAEANTLGPRPLILISDIDDTIRRTHILDRSEMLRQALRSSNSFAGMAQLYNSWMCADLPAGPTFQACVKRQGAGRSSARQMFYVPGAPGQAQKLAVLFLEESKFPSGQFIGRDPVFTDLPVISIIDAAIFNSTYDFKVSEMKKIIADFPDADFVLVGDNGEKDVAVFKAVTEWAKQNAPQSAVHSFVHQVYNDEKEGMQPAPEQALYVTALDLAVHFFNRGWIGARELTLALAQAESDWQYEPKHMIPNWVDCRAIGSKRRLAELSSTSQSQGQSLPSDLAQAITESLAKIQARCDRR